MFGKVVKREDLKGKRRPYQDTILANLEPEADKDYRVLVEANLYFLVRKSGSKSWQLRYKNSEQKWTFHGLGSYPMTSGAKARAIAKQKINQLSNGVELETKKVKARKAEDIKSRYFSTLMSEWLNTKQHTWGEATYSKAVKSIERHIIPMFGKRSFDEISPKEWFDFFQGLQRNLNIHTQVEKLTSYCRNAYDWAKFHGRVPYNPIEGMTKHLDKHRGGNMKYVEYEELPTLLKAIRGYPKRSLAIGLELFVLLFPRPVELRFATWGQFDLEKGVWVKPAEIMKMGISHGVPLPHQAITLLRELATYRTGDLLFPSRDSLLKPISDNTFNMALNRLGYKDRQNPHGFRHIASTQLNNKFSDKPQVVEACLAHMKKGVKGVYDKGAHFEERIMMMQWWADELDQF
nr:tyrosine-type recombinase/integrase [Acinetobacter sp. SA01]